MKMEATDMNNKLGVFFFLILQKYLKSHLRKILNTMQQWEPWKISKQLERHDTIIKHIFILEVIRDFYNHVSEM